MAQPAPAPRPPVILDILPHALGVGTIAGYCEEVIPRNRQVPAEHTRVFATSTDLQATVVIRVCAGNSRRIAENTLLGDLVLEGLEPRPRGQIKVAVTFQIDASGILQVRARDQLTGAERRVSLNIRGAQTPEQVAAASDRLRELRR
jgi:molecular chaperone DnaK